MQEQKSELLELGVEDKKMEKAIEDARELAQKQLEEPGGEIYNKTKGKVIEGRGVAEGSRLEIGKDTYKIIRVRDDGKVVMRKESK